MFEGPPRAYVYRSYGIHWCLNFVCGRRQRRADPRARADRSVRRDATPARDLDDLRALCSGPGKLCAALGVTIALDDHRLDAPPFAITLPRAAAEIAIGPRIGITKAAEIPWRFGIAGSRFLSRPFRTA